MARRPAGADVLMGSGTVPSLGEAMNGAEKTALRLPAIAGRIRTLVIVVDDDESVRHVVADVLRDDGTYQVAELGSGEGALRRLERTTRPAVLVTDIHLGAGMSGLLLAETVHAVRPSTGILLLSGGHQPIVDPAAANEFLAKPFSTTHLFGQNERNVRI